MKAALLLLAFLATVSHAYPRGDDHLYNPFKRDARHKEDFVRSIPLYVEWMKAIGLFPQELIDFVGSLKAEDYEAIEFVAAVVPNPDDLKISQIWGLLHEGYPELYHRGVYFGRQLIDRSLTLSNAPAGLLMKAVHAIATKTPKELNQGIHDLEETYEELTQEEKEEIDTIFPGLSIMSEGFQVTPEEQRHEEAHFKNGASQWVNNKMRLI